MTKFNVGDKVYNPKDKDRIYTVLEVDSVTNSIPEYIVLDADGETEWISYCFNWNKIIEPEEALRYGEVLTDDNFAYNVPSSQGYDEVEFTRIRTIRYEYRIFYHKMVNGEVVEFKELTI